MRDPIQVDVELIRAKIEAKGWSQAMLAKKAGVTRRTVEKVFERQTASIQTISRIATALGVDNCTTLIIKKSNEADDESLIIQVPCTLDSDKKLIAIQFQNAKPGLYINLEKIPLLHDNIEYIVNLLEAMINYQSGEPNQLEELTQQIRMIFVHMQLKPLLREYPQSLLSNNADDSPC